MNQEIEELKKGIKIHYIQTEQFKTNIVAVFLTVPLNRENITKNALIPAVLRRGTSIYKTQDEISKQLENMYGADFDVGIEKMGDNQIIKFYIESINDNYLPEAENILKKSLEMIFEISCNPLVENGIFKNEYVEGEKKNLKQIIESKIDNKDQYSLNRCIEIMYENEPYGLYKYGYTEDLNEINGENLFKQYEKLISNCKIDIFVSGNFKKEDVKKIILENSNFKKLNQRNPEYVQNNEINEKKSNTENIRKVEEKRDVTQGKVVIGMDIQDNNKDNRFIISMYNTILGDSANSKLFQNVREKANLAYSTRSSYIRQKNNIFIRCGIDIPNYEKCIKIIEEQLEDMKNGKFTEDELENAKKYVISSIKTVEEEQDTSIIYYIGQELSGFNISFDEYEKRINDVKLEQVQEIANKININSIYFLRN